MLKIMPDNYHHILMGVEPTKNVSKGTDYEIQQELAKFGIDWHNGDNSQVVELPLIKGLKRTPEILDEFYDTHGKLHYDRIEKLLSRKPRKPASMPRGSGWFIYQKGYWTPIDMPEPKAAFMFDFETIPVTTFIELKQELGDTRDYSYLNPDTWIPACCTAYDGFHWYFWGIDWDHPVQVIPFGDGITGINWMVSYDRAYLASEYNYATTNRFADPMTWLITVRGMGNQQKAVWLSMKNNEYKPAWWYETTTNGLDAAYKFYFKEELDKGVRDEIVKYGAPFVYRNFETVVNYCFDDIMATWAVSSRLYPEWLLAMPAKYNRVATLMMGSYQMFFDPERYPDYWENCETLYQEKIAEIQEYLLELAVKCLNNPTEHQKKHLDMTPASTGKTCGLPAWFRKVATVERKFSKKEPFTPGSVEKGDVKLKRDKTGKVELSLSSKVTPYLLSITYRGELVYFFGHHRTGTWMTDHHVMHPPKNPNERCAAIFVKDHLKFFETGVLSTSDNDPRVLEVMKITREVSIWVSTRKRDKAMYTQTDADGNIIFIPNSFLARGTATGRCADKHTQARANWKPKKIGTEMKGYMVAPEGYVLVGADVSGQETFLMGLYKDAYYGVHGANPFSFTCLTGEKKFKTDIHNMVAAFCGIERDDGKIATYSLMYLAGVKSIADTFATILVTNTPEQNREVAEKHYRYLKGTKYQGEFIGGLASEVFNSLIRLANQRHPRLPIGNVAMPKSMAGISDFLTTRGNWTVQALGAVFRDLWLCFTSYIMKHIGIVDAKPAISIHDELWYYVPEHQAKRAVYGLQLSHMMTIAQISLEFGIMQIPASYCWLEDVTVSKWLTKDTYHDNTTLSNHNPQVKPVVVEPSELLTWFSNPTQKTKLDEWLETYRG